MGIKKWAKKHVQQYFSIQPTDAPPVMAEGLPEVVLKLNGGIQRGPNCWNATILYFDPNATVKYVPPQEMNEWLQANTTPDQFKFQATGSILALYTEDVLIHTAVYVAPGILWHKRGCGGPWEFVTEKQLRQIYFEADRFDYLITKEAA